MKVSICIPIYGVEQYIDRCTRSVLEQTYPNIEYVFVNDCTKDRSLEILKTVIKDFPERHSSIKIITHLQNRGLAAARNTAIENCTGDFVMHVDSDDYLEKNAVELLVRKQEESEADIVSGNAYKETTEGQELLREPDYNNKEEMLLQCLRPTLDHVIWRRIIRLSLYRDNFIKAKEGVNVGEDWQVMPQLVYYAKKVAKIDDVIYHYNCMNPGSYMSQKNQMFNKIMAFQDIHSLSVLEDFFKDKEIRFRQMIQEVKIKFLERYLESAYKSKNTNSYNIIAKMVLNMDDVYMRFIGWDQLKIRFVNKRYMNRKIYDTFYLIVHECFYRFLFLIMVLLLLMNAL